MMMIVMIVMLMANLLVVIMMKMMMKVDMQEGPPTILANSSAKSIHVSTGEYISKIYYKYIHHILYKNISKIK